MRFSGSKGLFLSTDLLVGIVISIFLLGLVVFRSGILVSASYDVLKSVEASDVLIVLHKSGVLATANATIIQNKLNLMVKDYYFSVQYYNENLTNYLNLTIGSALDSFVFAKRPFYWYDNKTIIGVAELRLK